MWDMAQEMHRLLKELRKMAEEEWKLEEQKRKSSQKKLEWNFSGREVNVNWVRCHEKPNY